MDGYQSMTVNARSKICLPICFSSEGFRYKKETKAKGSSR